MSSGTKFLTVFSAVFVAAQALALAQTTNNPPDFREVYDLIASHSGLSDAELNREAVEGLLMRLGSRATLVPAGGATPSSTTGSNVIASRIFEGDIAYFRIAEVGGKLAKTVSDTFHQWDATNHLKGVVLDLRYADGANYAAAAELAGAFLTKPEPLLNWGEGMASAHEASGAISAPVAVLVNHDTAGAPEALAAAIRESHAGLVLGSRTAGCAMVMKDFPLKNGQTLRIATAPVLLGNGSALTADGVQPDIEVSVNPDRERAYYADSFLVPPATNLANQATNEAGGTNMASRHVRINEAELVRAHKEGIDLEAEPDAVIPGLPPAQPEAPVVSDPVLARSIDLLKGLAVVRQGK